MSDMIVKCIYNKYYEYGLTMGKSYDVSEEDDKYYRIINDTNYIVRYNKNCFKTLSEVRNETINNLLEE